MSSHTEMLRRRRPLPAAATESQEPQTKDAPVAPHADDSSSSCSDSTMASDNDAVRTAQHFQPSSSSSSSSPSPPSPSPSIMQSLLPWTGLAIWPLMLFLPLLLNHTTSYHYATIFPRSWYAINGHNWLDSSLEEGGIWEWGTKNFRNTIDGNNDNNKPPLRHPLGLTLGISAVAIGHVFLLIYFRLHQQQLLGPTTPVQKRGAVSYIYSAALTHHLSQPGGFLLLGLYLALTWIYDLLPPSYYSFEGGIQYPLVLACLVVQDCVQFVMHRIEHVAHPKMYRLSHKPHHKFTNPKLFDAFDGSVADTAIMILFPLFCTAHIVRKCNVWTYMAFGSTYANWLTLIHSEVIFPWERMFRRLGLGTCADHHVHHKFFKYNFGHLFMWADWVCGTYRSPREVWGKEFNEGV